MKSFIVLFALVAVAAADVSHVRARGADSEAQIVSQNSGVRQDSFNYDFETSNGISGQASAALKPHGEELALQVEGSHQHVGPDGVPYVITFTADENGYHPQGAHLPTPPPIPEDIQRSIEYNLKHNSKHSEKPDSKFRY